MEDKNVQKLLDMLFGMIDEAKGATFSSENASSTAMRRWTCWTRSATSCPASSPRLRS